MKACNIIKTHNYKTTMQTYATFKSKKEAVEYLNMIKKIAKNLYSKCVFSAKTDILTCYHGESDDITYFQIIPINQ